MTLTKTMIDNDGSKLKKKKKIKVTGVKLTNVILLLYNVIINK